MHIHTFDHFQNLHSPVHRLDPRVKVVLTVLMILSNVLLPDGAWLAYLLALILVWAANRLANLELGFLITRSFVALPFALAAVTVMFTLPGEPLYAIQVGGSVLVISDAGLIRFASILLRSWISIQAAIVLTATTPFPDLVHALRHLYVPSILVSIISFMYRYLFVMSDEVLRLLRAREARSAQGPGKMGGSLAWRAKVAGSMAGQLFLRSFERSDRVYNAMIARGYRGTLMTMNPHIMTRRDWVTGAVVLFLVLALQVTARLIY